MSGPFIGESTGRTAKPGQISRHLPAPWPELLTIAAARGDVD